MQRLIKKIAILLLLLRTITLPTLQARDVRKMFYDSMGLEMCTAAELDSLRPDSLFSYYLDKGDHKSLYEMHQVVVRAELSNRFIKKAITHSEHIYSIALLNDKPMGLALALYSMGDVHSYSGHYELAREHYVRAYNCIKELTDYAALPHYRRTILGSIVNRALESNDLDTAERYLQELIQTEEKLGSALTLHESTVIKLLQASLLAKQHKGKEARAVIGRIHYPAEEGYVSISLMRLLVEARVRWAEGRLELAKEEYDKLLDSNLEEINRPMFKLALNERAQLSIERNDLGQAYVDYGTILLRSRDDFNKNYGTEIQELTTRFQADRLKEQTAKKQLNAMQVIMTLFGITIIVFFVFIILAYNRIVRLKKLRAVYKASAAKAANAIRQKNLFLSNMSHELRSPLNAIVGFSGIFASEESDELDEETRQEYVDVIKANSSQLLTLINDILDLGDLDTHSVSFKIERHDAVKLCQETLNSVRASLPNRNKVELRFETSLQVLDIDTDQSRLRQVITNLLTNAMKFTTKGSVVLSLKLQEGRTALFSVTDTGCGIPLDKQKKVFERFEKVDERAQGTGIGLSISQLIVEYMQGRIWIDPDYTAGARFCFTHPIVYNPVVEKRKEKKV